MDKHLLKAAEELGSALKKQGLRLSIAESCTAGLVCTSLGAASDSKAFFTSGFVTYSDEAKHRMLNVSYDTLKVYSAVSEQAVREMATGAQDHSGEAVSLAISGYAGPDGGTDGTPAGTIWFAWSLPGKQLYSCVKLIEGEPEDVIHAAALYALCRLTELLTGSKPHW